MACTMVLPEFELHYLTCLQLEISQLQLTASFVDHRVHGVCTVHHADAEGGPRRVQGDDGHQTGGIAKCKLRKQGPSAAAAIADAVHVILHLSCSFVCLALQSTGLNFC